MSLPVGRKRLFLLILAGGAALAETDGARAQTATPGDGQPASAQQDEGASASGNISDIVVTARRRSEKLLDVPQSISVVTPADIDAKEATNLSELQQEIPSLRIVQLAPGAQRIELRGVSQYQGLDTVGSYLNEVSVAGSQGGDPDIRLIDLSGIEVLRGPQPTLYGANSVGGTIRYITAAPNLSQFSGHLGAEGGFVASGGGLDRVDAVMNVPLIKNELGVRLVVDHADSGGWIDAPALGKKDINNLDANTFRGSALWVPDDQLTVSFVYQYQQESQEGQSFSGRDRKTTALLNTPTDDDFHFGNVVVSYDAGPVTLLSTTGYYYRSTDYIYDVTPFYSSFLPPGGLAPEGVQGNTRFVTQELRVTSNGSGPLRYLLGGEFNDLRSSGNVTIDTSPKTSFSPFLDYDENSYASSQSWAIYGSLSYDVTDRIEVDLGGRYFQDDQTLATDTLSFGGGKTFQNATFHSFNPRVDLKYKTSDTGILYFNFAKGFRSGGFNAVPGPNVPNAYGPEKLFTYEIGAKQQFFDRRLTLQPAFYYNDYQSIQEQLPIPGNVQGNSFTLNAGKASGPGFDLSALFAVTPDLSVNGTVGYNHLRLDSASLAKAKGDPLDLVPDWTWSVGGDYHVDVADETRLTVHADVTHTDTGRITLRQLQSTTYSDPYTLVSTRVGLEYQSYEVYVFANNLLDTNRKVQPPFGGYAEPLYTRPRTVGLGLRADF